MFILDNYQYTTVNTYFACDHLIAIQYLVSQISIFHLTSDVCAIFTVCNVCVCERYDDPLMCTLTSIDVCMFDGRWPPPPPRYRYSPQ